MIPLPTALFDRYSHDLHPRSEPLALGSAGGLSGSRLWRYEASRGCLVVKLWPSGRSGEEVQAIHDLVLRASGLGFLAVPQRGLDGASAQTIGGLVWEIAPWMPGEPDLADPPDPLHVLSAFEALGAVHRAWGPPQGACFSPGLAGRVREMESLPADIASWRTIVGSWPESATTELARSWMDMATRVQPWLLPRIRGIASRPIRVQTVIRDARPDHFLFVGPRLTGLIDFGAMGVEAVSADLARLLGDWPGVSGELRERAITSYERNRPMDDEERGRIAAFEQTAALLRGARWVRWYFVDRRPFDDPGTVDRGLRRAVEQVTRLGVVCDSGSPFSSGP